MPSPSGSARPAPVGNVILDAFLQDFREAWRVRHRSQAHREHCERILAFCINLRDGHGEVEDKPVHRYVVEDTLVLAHEIVVLHRKGYKHPMHAFRVAKRRLQKYVPKQRCWRKLAVWRGGKELRKWEYAILGGS